MLQRTKGSSEQGLTVIEVCVAIPILVVGMLAAATLAGKMMSTSRQSKYMSLAATLASEKLEDLNRWTAADPHVCVPTGSTTAGSLTTDITLANVTCPGSGGASGSISYHDEVLIGTAVAGDASCPDATVGCFSETVTTKSSGVTKYLTTAHAADGTVQSIQTDTPPSSPTFRRRWIFEQDVPVTGVRRMTVLVTSLDQTVQPPVTFQMSLVRP